MNERFDEAVSKWLEESAPARLPERVLNATFELTRRSRQHVGWRAVLARSLMNRNFFAVGGAAAALLVAVAAIGIYVNIRPDVGGQPTPGATVAPTATATAVPTASASPTRPPEAKPVPTSLQELAPGRYLAVNEGFRFDYDVPRPGWTQVAPWAMAREGTPPEEPALFALWGSVTNVYADGCHWRDSLIDPPVGPSVADFANALGALKDSQVSAPIDVTVGGYDGKHIQVMGPKDLDFSECDGGEYRLWADPDENDGGGLNQRAGDNYPWPWIVDHWILDLDGNRFVIVTETYEGTTDETVDELRQIIESMDIHPQP